MVAMAQPGQVVEAAAEVAATRATIQEAKRVAIMAQVVVQATVKKVAPLLFPELGSKV
jgi:hypothetical protein